MSSCTECPYSKPPKSSTSVLRNSSGQTEDLENKSENIKLYAARDKETGKLVNNITNPRRKFWEKRGSALAAIEGRGRQDLELVEFELVEVRNNKGYRVEVQRD